MGRKRKTVGEPYLAFSAAAAQDSNGVAVVPVEICPYKKGVPLKLAFWNVQNFTGDLIRHGKNVTKTPLSAPRNQVRIEFIAKAIKTLNLDALALMELGSDGETVMRGITEKLNAEKEGVWNSTFSLESGARFEYPEFIEINIYTYKEYERQLSSLRLTLKHYDVTHFEAGAMAGVEMRIHGHRELDADFNPEVREALESVEAIANGCSPDAEANAIKKLEEFLKDVKKDKPLHQMLSDMLTAAPSNVRDIQQRIIDCDSTCSVAPDTAVAIAIAHRGGTLKLKLKAIHPVPEEGLFVALRYFKVIDGYYERYGCVFRTELTESSISHKLVYSDVWKIGEKTNSRQAWAFNLSVGGKQVSAYLIHSMFGIATTKIRSEPTAMDADVAEDVEMAPEQALEEDEGKVISETLNELRVRTLIAQADVANKSEYPPVFIMGDTNIATSHLDDAIGKMKAVGYGYMSGRVKTTLKAEATILYKSDAAPSEYFNQPYDAVYQRKDTVEDFLTSVSYPFDEQLYGIFNEALGSNEHIKNWYLELLVLKLSCVTDLFKLRRYSGWENVFLTAASSAKFSHELKGDEYIEASRNLSAQLKTEKIEDARLNGALVVYHEVVSCKAKIFALFHRKFISDHRIVVMDMILKNEVSSAGESRSSNAQDEWEVIKKQRRGLGT